MFSLTIDVLGSCSLCSCACSPSPGPEVGPGSLPAAAAGGGAGGSGEPRRHQGADCQGPQSHAAQPAVRGAGDGDPGQVPRVEGVQGPAPRSLHHRHQHRRLPDRLVGAGARDRLCAVRGLALCVRWV